MRTHFMLRLSHQCRFSYFEIPDFAVVYMTGVQVVQFTLSAHSFHTYTSTVQNTERQTQSFLMSVLSRIH